MADSTVAALNVGGEPYWDFAENGKSRCRVKELREENDMNLAHYGKRKMSHGMFHGFLKQCGDGQCPNFNRGEKVVYLLVDISLEGYPLETVKIYHAQGNADQVATKARDRIRTVLNCRRVPSLDASVFDNDTRQVMGSDPKKKPF